MSAQIAHDPVRVLVVDDQEVYRETARFVVDLSDGFELVGMAGTGEEGLDRARELQPDLVLMDINMPGIDGLEATRRLHADSPEVAVIVFSTHSAREFESLAIDAGAIGFIPKGDLTPAILTETWGRAGGATEG